MLNTILCILISIAFVYILANPKVPNSLLFLLLAPILILTHVLEAVCDKRGIDGPLQGRPGQP